MSAGAGLEWFREMMWVAVMSGAPVVGAVAVIGLALAILQAATQVNDAAVPFAAKALGVFVALTAGGSWMLTQMVDFAHRALSAIGQITG